MDVSGLYPTYMWMKPGCPTDQLGYKTHLLLVGGDWLPFLCSHIYWVYVIIQIDEVIFFRGVAEPPTRLSGMSHQVSILISAFGAIC